MRLNHLVVAAVMLLATAGCGPDMLAPADGEQAELEQGLANAPASKTVKYTWQGQVTGYFCGPASTRIALTTRQASPPTQWTIANYEGTSSSSGTSRSRVVSGLNHYLNTSVYKSVAVSDPPTAAQRASLKSMMVGTLTNNYTAIANVVSGWRPPGYPSGTIYHYVAVVGYDQNGDRMLIADPAGRCSAGSRWCNVPATYWVTTQNLGTWVGLRGYVATSLAPPVAPPPPAAVGTLTGAIYQKGDPNNRVSGAVVTAAGKSVTTGADGLYEFNLAPGSYTATVKRTGYSSATVTRTVTAGAKIWGSMEINAVPVAANGTLKGKVFILNPANTADMSRILSGAVVTLGNQTKTTGADGLYEFSVPAGTYTVRVTKEGYAAASLSRTVTSGAVIWGSVGLSSGTVDSAPRVTIESPEDGASLQLANVELNGSVDQDVGGVATVLVSLNGGEAAPVAVSAGQFSAPLKLVPGENTVVVTAKDGSGKSGTATWHLTFAAGIAGVVFPEENEEGNVPGASVTLFETDGTTPVARATTEASGRFTLPLMQVPFEGTLVVEAPGFGTFREAVQVPADEQLQVKVALGPEITEGQQGPGDEEPPVSNGELGEVGTSCSSGGMGSGIGLLGLLLPLLARSRSRRRRQ